GARSIGRKAGEGRLIGGGKTFGKRKKRTGYDSNNQEEAHDQWHNVPPKRKGILHETRGRQKGGSSGKRWLSPTSCAWCSEFRRGCAGVRRAGRSRCATR